MDNQYTGDALGRIKSITKPTATDSWNFSCDTLSWLMSASDLDTDALDETYSYSDSGNSLSRTRMAGTYVYATDTAIRPHAAPQIGC